MTQVEKRDWAVRIVVAAVSGWALSLMVAPYEWHGLHWIVYVPMFAALDPARPRANAALGWLYGVAGVGSIFHWVAITITLFSNIPWYGAYAILGLFAFAFSFTYPVLWGAVHPLRQRLGDGWILAVPALQVVLEWFAQFVLLFPYNHGVTQYRVPFTWQIVSITGVYGLTFLFFFWNAAIAEAVFRWREGRPLPVRWLSAAVIAASLVVIHGAWRYERIEAALRGAPTLTVAQMQSSETMMQRLRRHPDKESKIWFDKSLSIAPGAVDLVVWPEGAQFDSLDEPDEARKFGALARWLKADILVGSGQRAEPPNKPFNTVYHVGRDGKVTGKYNKMVPLPFGEYMPLRNTPLSPLVDWIEGVGDFDAGTEAVVLGDGNWKFATPICYEAILGRVCSQFADYDLFVTVTNDAWFGDSSAPAQHAMLAAVRATELGAPVVREAYTGVSFVVEPHGVIHSETAPFTDVHRKVTVRMARFDTVYARFGDWFVALCAFGLAGAGIAVASGRAELTARG